MNVRSSLLPPRPIRTSINRLSSFPNHQSLMTEGYQTDLKLSITDWFPCYYEFDLVSILKGEISSGNPVFFPSYFVFDVISDSIQGRFKCSKKLSDSFINNSRPPFVSESQFVILPMFFLFCVGNHETKL